MSRIDSVLGIVRQQGADELRVGVDQEPRMFAGGVPKRLSIPATSEETLRVLLGDLLTPERERELREQGNLVTNYDAGALGVYRVSFTALAHGFEATFVNVEALDDEPVAARAETAVTLPPRPNAEPGHESATTRPPRIAQPVAPASSRLAELVQRAAALQASDLHLGQGEGPSLRINGSLQRMAAEPIDDLAATLALDADALTRLAQGEASDLAFEIEGVGRVRVHVYPSASGPAAAVRLLPRAAPTFASLNMPFAFDDLVDLPHGLVLVCGAAGSGKSTTLAALAQVALQRRSLMLVTLEDPIEYALTASATSIVRRRQIGRDVRDFATGLRDALRADPELLLLGELRDPETIALALTAAETGHLVLASMHSGSAASAIERIIDAFPSGSQNQIRVQLAESLRAVVAQRLLRRVHGEGRLPAVEVLRVTRAVASLIRDAKTAQLATALQSNRREGMIALERCLADRVLAGEIRADDAYAAANDPETLAIFLARRA